MGLRPPGGGRIPRGWIAGALTLGLALAPLARAQTETLSEPAQDEAVRPTTTRSVVDLQRFRREESIPIRDAAGRRGRASLIDLNPRIHSWFLLSIAWEGTDDITTVHLENADPTGQTLHLDPDEGGRLVIASREGETTCTPWSQPAGGGLTAARAAATPYAPLCGERLYLRDTVPGRRTAKEWAADLLRDHVWGGEKITTLVRDTLFKDAWLSTPRLGRDGGKARRLPGIPVPPQLAPAYRDQDLAPDGLGIAAVREEDGRMGIGRWYPVEDQPGIFLSAVTPGAIDPEVMAGARHPVNPLDPVESGALAYLVAFDLYQFAVGFAVGTDHPRVDWSRHMRPDMRDDSLPGPDGIGTIAPLVRTGMLSPAQQGLVAATFTGGFKRSHGAMRYGPLAYMNHGSHYGFLEEGVVLSELQPGLSTLWVLNDGRVQLGTWSAADTRYLERVRFARQNGVPLVDFDAATGRSGPGALVTYWGAGNWSGSKDNELRTLRAGLCLLEGPERRYLVYGWFSTATPSAMATVFMGYGCRYAMLDDMNALEHTYLALYHRREGKLLVQHLTVGMSVLDKQAGDQYVPRFVAFPDNRDFFYLLRRSGP